MVVYEVNMTCSFHKRNQFIRKISVGPMKLIYQVKKNAFGACVLRQLTYLEKLDCFGGGYPNDKLIYTQGAIKQREK